MKSLQQLINEAGQNITMYMGPWPEKKWDGGWITTDSKTAAEYRKYQETQLKKNMGECPKKADPKGLFDGVKNISGEEHNKWNVYVVFDQQHESAKWGSTLASIVYVDDNMDYENISKIDDKYPTGKYYKIGGEIRNNIFYMALS